MPLLPPAGFPLWEGALGHELELAECAVFWGTLICALLLSLLLGSSGTSLEGLVRVCRILLG